MVEIVLQNEASQHLGSSVRGLGTRSLYPVQGELKNKNTQKNAKVRFSGGEACHLFYVESSVHMHYKQRPGKALKRNYGLFLSSPKEEPVHWLTLVAPISGSDGNESTCSAGNQGLIPGSGRSPGGENGNPFQYSCLENPMDRGVWQATVHEIGHD